MLPPSLLQVSAGWKHGDSVDEQVKCHPLLKPYKALSEKVNSVSNGAPAAAEGGDSVHYCRAHTFWLGTVFCTKPAVTLFKQIEAIVPLSAF